jgi:hypothetical protein
MDNRVIVNEADFKILKDKVVVLTGTHSSASDLDVHVQLTIQAAQMASGPPQSGISPTQALMSFSETTTLKPEKAWSSRFPMHLQNPSSFK